MAAVYNLVKGKFGRGGQQQQQQRRAGEPQVRFIRQTSTADGERATVLDAEAGASGHLNLPAQEQSFMNTLLGHLKGGTVAGGPSPTASFTHTFDIKKGGNLAHAAAAVSIASEAFVTLSMLGATFLYARHRTGERVPFLTWAKYMAFLGLPRLMMSYAINRGVGAYVNSKAPGTYDHRIDFSVSAWTGGWFSAASRTRITARTELPEGGFREEYTDFIGRGNAPRSNTRFVQPTEIGVQNAGLELDEGAGPSWQRFMTRGAAMARMQDRYRLTQQLYGWLREVENLPASRRSVININTELIDDLRFLFQGSSAIHTDEAELVLSMGARIPIISDSESGSESSSEASSENLGARQLQRITSSESNAGREFEEFRGPRDFAARYTHRSRGSLALWASWDWILASTKPLKPKTFSFGTTPPPSKIAFEANKDGSTTPYTIAKGFTLDGLSKEELAKVDYSIRLVNDKNEMFVVTPDFQVDKDGNLIYKGKGLPDNAKKLLITASLDGYDNKQFSFDLEKNTAPEFANPPKKIVYDPKARISLNLKKISLGTGFKATDKNESDQDNVRYTFQLINSTTTPLDSTLFEIDKNGELLYTATIPLGRNFDKLKITAHDLSGATSEVTVNLEVNVAPQFASSVPKSITYNPTSTASKDKPIVLGTGFKATDANGGKISYTFTTVDSNGTKQTANGNFQINDKGELLYVASIALGRSIASLEITATDPYGASTAHSVKMTPS